MLIPLGIWAGSGGAETTYELIQTQILGANAANITFSSIPQTYKHLQFRFSVVASLNGDNMAMRFNGDTGTNYSRHALEGMNASTSSNATINYSWIPVTGWNMGVNTSIPWSGVFDVLDYTAAKNKTVRGLNGTYNEIAINSGMWMSTAAITSMTFLFMSGNIGANSRISLYGIKG